METTFRFRVRRSDIENARMMVIDDFQQIGDWRDMAMYLENCGQFTGLLDKNGKEIYEGDIVKTMHGYIGEIKFDSPSWGIDYHEEKETGAFGVSIYIKRFYEESEIIGNIFENHELLSGGEK